jgi:hypothetical protein
VAGGSGGERDEGVGGDSDMRGRRTEGGDEEGEQYEAVVGCRQKYERAVMRRRWEMERGPT